MLLDMALRTHYHSWNYVYWVFYADEIDTMLSEAKIFQKLAKGFKKDTNATDLHAWFLKLKSSTILYHLSSLLHQNMHDGLIDMCQQIRRLC